MKVMKWTAYGPPEVLHYTELKKPVPEDNELLIKIRAATVTAGDCELRRFDIAGWIWLPVRLFMGLFKPKLKVLGQEFSGEVIAIGKKITQWKVGDTIFAEGGMKMGGYAQYTCISNKRTIAIIPSNMDFEEAATIPTGGINALHFIRKAQVNKGDHILINGAGGSIGTYAVQIAKHLGAYVTAVDSTTKLTMLADLGADVVIDYSKKDFTQNDTRYDAIIDVVGTSHFSRSLQVLQKNGKYILGNPRLTGMLRGIWKNKTSSKKVIFQLAHPKKEDFEYLKSLIETNNLKAIIDKKYPLAQLVEAHHYVEQGFKKGNIVITIPHDD